VFEELFPDPGWLVPEYGCDGFCIDEVLPCVACPAGFGEVEDGVEVLLPLFAWSAMVFSSYDRVNGFWGR
jgi:hypothetical protein